MGYKISFICALIGNIVLTATLAVIAYVTLAFAGLGGGMTAEGWLFLIVVLFLFLFCWYAMNKIRERKKAWSFYLLFIGVLCAAALFNLNLQFDTGLDWSSILMISVFAIPAAAHIAAFTAAAISK